MDFCWMIRLLDTKPWTERICVDKYKWLLEEQPFIWPNHKNKIK